MLPLLLVSTRQGLPETAQKTAITNISIITTVVHVRHQGPDSQKKILG